MDPTLIITTLVALVGRVLPVVAVPANATLIEEVIQTLVGLVPTLIKEYQDLLPEVQNIIAALRGGPLTQAQQDALDALQAQADAAFEAAAAAKGIAPDPGAAPAVA